MKVTILTEGGSERGMGHITRCLAIRDGLMSRGAECAIFVNPDSPGMKLPYQEEYTELDWLRDGDGPEHALKGANFAVVDSYRADREDYDRISSIMGTKVVMIDDYDRIDYPEGNVVCPSIYGTKMPYKEKKGVRYWLGPGYIFLRKEFYDVPERKIRKEVRKVFITLGGSDRGALAGRISGEIDRLSGGRMEITATAGADKPFSPAEMVRAMMDADICVSGGGQTLHELARTGLPTVAIRLADNQKMNVEGWAAAGFVEYAGNAEDRDVHIKAASKIISLFPGEIRENRSRVGLALVDGKGALRMADKMFEAAGEDSTGMRLRPAEEKDVEDIWRWRNHPDVRKRSIDSREIHFSEHREWFAAQLADGSSTIYISETGSDKTGQARFNRTGQKEARISVNLNPEFFGRGFGTWLIRKATERFLEEAPAVKEVLAEILPDNPASVRAFEKAGYSPRGEGVSGGKKVRIFVMERI
ncbi:MAG: bifunctional UDP-2,4-diacetamido-2,4,6-trideoxy-beta-L-altropyranose hydrolase/GNAT family N-acetyltransferase [Candidatus Omnitrophica bacterium]|nr:bifunctional UDP-2,4-diacetamido-2,4,6-trideoxy-beta-L-altropyranose hydrolase/GNAT family N-acetyltransferase [Candidatus Omnitrophota bacterium]MDD5488831.1 bifunctional UDP-2,4-diacetamido-2,4,6-trideoxy-beta-L-altropyranose hydrolase/GNAT family N-acetyltransferase [Candidatus Omnitrophota bacterium]